MTALAIAIVALAACGSTPAATASAAPSAAGGQPAGPTPVEPTPVAGTGGDVPAEGQATVVAQNIAFEPAQVAVAADVPQALILDNRDQGTPHGIAVTGPDGSSIAKSEIITGPGQVELRFGPLAAGIYSFVCPVHPNMTGMIKVGS
jgi:plastocyanin